MNVEKMEELAIKRGFGPDIVFQGELLVRSERPCPPPSAFGRWHDITVYRRSDGMWVVRIDFHTLSLHERPRAEVEIVDCPDDVEVVLSAHEPTQHLNHRSVRPRQENDKRRFLKTLVTNYDSQVNDVTAAMERYVEEHRARTPTAAQRVSRGGWRGLLEMVGVGRSRKQFADDPGACSVEASADRGCERSQRSLGE
jgi:hypothetical protein